MARNQHQVTHLKSISLTPRWSPDATKIAFTCYVPFRGITSPQICIYSTASDRLISFPRYRGSNSSPACSPDGSQIAFMSSQNGDPEIYVTDAGGGNLHRITFAAGVNTSPALNPKTGKQIAFVSDRGGDPVLYLANSDGSDVAETRPAGHGLQRGSVVVTEWTTFGLLLETPERQFRHLCYGCNQPASWWSSRAMLDATNGRVGRPTGGTLCLSRREPVRGKYGPCWPMEANRGS